MSQVAIWKQLAATTPSPTVGWAGSLLPVADLSAGRLVRAIAGNRRAYQPLYSAWAGEGCPDTFFGRLAAAGFSDVYVADLDALGGQPPQCDLWNAVAAHGLRGWLDPGVTNAEQVQAWIAEQRLPLRAVLILATESLSALSDFSEMAAIWPREQLAVSVDLRAGRLQGSLAREPREVVAAAADAGLRQVIVLDLAAVGTAGGPATIELCRDVAREFPSVEFVSGGGVRNPQDVQAFLAAGCRRVLVGTWLHGQPAP